MDRAYEDNKTRALAEEHGFNVVVPPKKNRKDPWEYDKELYKKRNQVERYFLRIKRFRKVFTRYDKLDSIFLSVIMLAMIFDALFMWTRSNTSYFYAHFIFDDNDLYILLNKYYPVIAFVQKLEINKKFIDCQIMNIYFTGYEIIKPVL